METCTLRKCCACRFAAIDSLADLHHSLMAQQELQTVAPSSRWDTETTFNPQPSPGQACSRFGTYVESTYAFDGTAFGLQPNEALLMDPQQRLLLEETLSAFHDAGHSAWDMTGSSTGVFLGYAKCRQMVPVGRTAQPC